MTNQRCSGYSSARARLFRVPPRTAGAWIGTAVATIAAAAGVSAQVLYGSIVGTVSDPQGSFVPGVTVVATNTGTGARVETVSDENGAYTLRNLLPGVYDISAALTGFREHQEKGLNVTAGNPVRVNVTLVIGALNEVVEVTSERTLLQTDKADLSTELTPEEIVNLPLNVYRNYQALMNLVPGATPFQEQNATIDTPARSLRTWVNGTQPNSNATRIDGAVSVNIWLPHHVGYIQPAETIETVNVSTNNFDAEYGMAAGAASTVVTKSGTNDLHGSAFVFRNQDEFNANSFNNNAFDLLKDDLSRNTYGGTLGGPVVRNRLFYFASVERYQERRSLRQNLTVPTALMRQGDFSEVAAAYPTFRLFDPSSGGAGGVGRSEFANVTIPSNLIDSIARSVMAYYPLPDPARDINTNGILDDFTRQVPYRVDRDNYDAKVTWQRSAAHSVWGKFSMLDAEVNDNFILGFDAGSLGDTRTYVATAGHTWTLGPTLLLDGNFGANIQNQTVTGPDYGSNLGLDLGIRGVNQADDIRASGLPTFDFVSLYDIGTTPNWMPLFRKERSFTFSTALTKVFPKHDVRVGVDVVHHRLNHRQAEFGTYGLKGGFGFSHNTTGAAGYISPGWNDFASFLLGLPSSYSKDVQPEEMTGREWQNAFYVQDRWAVSSRTTIAAGLRVENYPLMRRKDRGIERLDYSTFTMLLGGLGDVPDDVGIELQTWYLAPRVGVMHRLTDNQVLRAGYGRTVNPLPWSRPMRGSFPFDISLNATADQFAHVTTLAQGIPPVPVPDISSGRVRLPQGVFVRSPNPTDVDRGIIQQWNIAYEYRWPWDIATEFAYVGTRTDGGYADLNINFGEPGGGNASRQFFDVAGTTAINDWAARTKSRYHGLQIAINRPFENGLLLKGAYTLSRSKNMTSNDEDGWTGLDYNHPLVYDLNYALAGFDRTHVFQMGFVYALPWLQESRSVAGTVLGGWQVNGIFGAYSGTPYSITGTNNALDCPSCGSIRVDVSGDPEPTGSVGSSTEPHYPVEIFSQPTGVGREGFGTSGRNRFRRPAVWNLDLSLFKAFPLGRIRPELRIEASNVLNHANWGAPVTTITANNFMRFTPGSVENGTNTPGARRIQLALRVQF